MRWVRQGELENELRWGHVQMMPAQAKQQELNHELHDIKSHINRNRVFFERCFLVGQAH